MYAELRYPEYGSEAGVSQSVSASPSELEDASTMSVSFDRRLFLLSSDPCCYSFETEY